MVLMLGCLLFHGSAWGPLTTLTDSRGAFVYSLPPLGLLGVVFQHQALWWWTNALFIVSSLVTMLGLAMLARLLQAGGDRIFSHLGLILFVCGTSFWCIQLTSRLSVDVRVAQEVARTGVLPDFYTPLLLWTQTLFVLYRIVSFAAIALYGGSVLSTCVLPHWVGWLAIVYGVAGLGILGIAGDAPPFLQYLLPLLMGILLLGSSQRAMGSHSGEEAQPVSLTPAS
jgi:hypothetical protein